MRFHHAMERLRDGGDRWADVALDCGYYDQPHLNREFRELGRRRRPASCSRSSKTVPCARPACGA